MTVFEKNDAIEEAFRGKIEPVAAYVRVSHQEQVLHGVSLSAQRQKLQKYADEHNMRIVEWYVDEGVSGRKLIRNRPELQRMIKDAQNNKFDRIIFIKLDRFFRSVAEYHECMKQIAPVIWTATEESYDLSTANGRMLVNMKLTISELEADVGGERIRIVNDYKTTTGQPLTGSMPFGFKIVNDEHGRKKIIRDPEMEEILYDAIRHFMTYQSKRKTVFYLHAKYNISIPYKSFTNLLKNSMLYGTYRGNPTYCEAYLDKETWDRLQEIGKNGAKDNTKPGRSYLFGGLIKCPQCGLKLKGGIHHRTTSIGNKVSYKKYRCGKHQLNATCGFSKSVSENTIEKMLLANIEKYMEDAKLRSFEVSEGSAVIPKYDINAIHDEIDRLNYSWKTGKIRKVEQYEKDYEDLMNKLAEAEAEQEKIPMKDFSKVEEILSGGWREIYKALDDEHRKAFWRSFITSIEIDWTTDKKEITKVIFF